MAQKLDDLTKLISILNQSKTQRDNPALHQTILGLIHVAQQQINGINTQIASIKSTPSGGGPPIDTSDFARRHHDNAETGGGDNSFTGINVFKNDVIIERDNAFIMFADDNELPNNQHWMFQTSGGDFLIYPTDADGIPKYPNRATLAAKTSNNNVVISGAVKIYNKNGLCVFEIPFNSRDTDAVIGTIANFSDSETATLGAVIATGGGINHVLARFDGTDWRVIGANSPISGGTGNVVGPASATDNAIARYDLTTGKLIQNSLVTIDDSGNFFLPANTSILTASGALALGGNSSASQVGINSTGFAPIINNTLNLGGSSNRWKDAYIAGTVNAGDLGSTPLNASNLNSGTVPDARFPATLPAVNGTNLTNLNGSNVTSGTVAAARIDSAIARLASPTFTGSPSGPTPTTGNNSTLLATTAFVQSTISPSPVSWTPIDVSGAGLTFTSPMGSYIVLGKLVFFQCGMTWPSTANGAQATIGGLPFTSTNQFGGMVAYSDYTGMDRILVQFNQTYFLLYTNTNAVVTNANMSLKTAIFTAFYFRS